MNKKTKSRGLWIGGGILLVCMIGFFVHILGSGDLTVLLQRLHG